MARLKSKHKRFVVKRLAVYDRPSDVRDQVRSRFGLDVDTSQLAHYDPTTRKGQGLAQDLQELFYDVRERFLEEYTETAIQHKAVRLKRLERAADQFHDMGHYVAEMDALEQAAKEMGDAYTNKRRVDATLTDTDSINWQDLTDEQLDRIAEGDPIRSVLADSSKG
jgi:hypothetical protein